MLKKPDIYLNSVISISPFKSTIIFDSGQLHVHVE
jgi:hypothetical protein